jgi:uncharacterized protein
MADAAVAIANKPAWIDLGTKDPAAAREFYNKVFGWNVEVNPDPQYGGYGLAKLAGKDVAGIGGTQSPDQPSAWSFYVGTADIEKLGKDVEAAGGKVIAPAFDVGDQGKMAVYQDPVGAFISSWQPTRMGGFQTQGANAFGWAELSARGIDKALPFYEKVFGWKLKKSDAGGLAYTEFLADGESIAGAVEMDPMVPAEMPNYWLVYFNVADVDRSFKKAIDAGAREAVAPQDFPGGRFAIVSDPQGAFFGLMQLAER